MSLTAAALVLLAGQAAPALAANSLIVAVPRPDSASAGADVAYAELSRGEDRAALAKLVAARADHAQDPAVLLNLAAAYTRLGEMDRALETYDAALSTRVRYDLETGDGHWADSRVLAADGRRASLRAL
ncbi:hypothetical protein MTR62_11625, partial [Novosphingobium sp. 1949]